MSNSKQSEREARLFPEMSTSDLLDRWQYLRTCHLNTPRPSAAATTIARRIHFMGIELAWRDGLGTSHGDSQLGRTAYGSDDYLQEVTDE